MGLLDYTKKRMASRGGSEEWREFLRGAPEQTGHGISQGSGHSLIDPASSFWPSSYTGLTETSTSWSAARADILLAPEPPATPDCPAPPWGSTFRSSFLSAAAEHEAKVEEAQRLFRGELQASAEAEV